MSDWLGFEEPSGDASPLERELMSGTARRANPLVAAIPFMQVACVGAAVAIVITAPPLLGWVAWMLGAIVVPLLWALFFVEYKKREVTADRFPAEARRKRVNHLMLLAGLAVGMIGAFSFATEVAK